MSRAATEWERELSPFFLGPCELYDGHVASCVETGWQNAKLYRSLADVHGEPTPAYWAWAKEGWAGPAVRYPMGKGAKPLCLLWQGRRLGYVEARHQVYWRLYRDAVKSTSAFRRLQALHARGPVALFDFDGYDHDSLGMTLQEALVATDRPMGHAFVLKSMLLWGLDVEASDVLGSALEAAKSPPTQASLF